MKKKLAVLLALVLALAVFVDRPIDTMATPFSSITSESIKEKENQIEQAQEEKENLQDTLTDVKEIKKKLEKEKQDLSKYVEQLDGQLVTIQENIARLNGLINEKEIQIAETQVQLEEARRIEEEQYDAMVQRIRFMYTQGETTYMDMIFSGDSVSDILNQVVYMEQISAYDRQQLDEFMLNRQLIEACERQLIADKELLDAQKAGVEAEETAMEELIAEKEATIVAYQTDIKNKEQAIADYEADIAAQNEIIEALEAAVAAERKRIMEANGVVLTYDGGQFKMPIASYTRVSSPYGWRMHPTLGVEKYHNGIDLASPTGTAIYAAYDGIVVAAAYSSSMGNYVMIDHGSGLYTIYMHASKLYVSEDDVVVRGETIAAVGSTGRSTGPHLHFGVRSNGAYVDPSNYVSFK